ncbi:MFS transporter [Campylobacter sp. LR286c]|uniref:MFS transporter n=1 Tax=Campylobacter sp. LR286c TaxID=2593545 RepID=UPI0012381A0C|nr:MFS transporter [Campylobacter sp. LR286c]KAA6229818.1 multidrug efflux MFS transporter [Campylobacter sp. LR286c]
MSDFKKTVFVCWFGIFTTSMGLSQMAPILPLYMKNLGYTNSADIAFYSGLAFGITPLFMAIFSPIWAWVGAKFGYKKMLLRASLGMSVLTLCLTFLDTALEVVLVRAFTGIFSGFNSAAIVFIAMIAPKRKVTATLGALSTASISGSLLGPLFGGIVAEILNIKGVFYFISSLIACSFLTILFFIKENKNKNKKVIHKKAQSLEKNEKNLSLIIVLFIVTFFIQVGTFGIMPMITLFVDEIYNGTYIAFYSGLVVAVAGISNLIFTPFIARLADKVGPSKVIFVALIFCGLTYFLQAISSNIYMLILYRFILGMGLGGLMPCVNALFKKGINTKNLNIILGFNQSAQFLGNFSGSFVNGALVASFAPHVAFIFVGIIFILNALLFGVIEKRVIFSHIRL